MRIPAAAATALRHWPLYAFLLLVVRPIVRLFIGVAVHGREHLRFTEPSIFVANHNSHLDAVVLMDLMRLGDLPRVRPVAAADTFARGAWSGAFWRRCMNVLPIRRDKVSRLDDPARAMVDALDSGATLILFPEGTRGEPERFSPLKPGIARVLSERPRTPVVPVYMRNLGFSMPRGDLVIVPLFCDVYVGPPRVVAGGRKEILRHVAFAFDELIAEADAARSAAAPDDDS